MKITERVRSTEYPITIDTNNDTVVYVRKNIKAESETDPIFGTITPIFVYDEIEYTWSEWYNLNIDKLNGKVDSMVNILISLLGKIDKDYDVTNLLSEATDLFIVEE